MQFDQLKRRDFITLFGANQSSLASVEHGLTPEYGALSLGSPDTFVATLADELTLKLIEPAHDCWDEFAVGGGSIQSGVL